MIFKHALATIDQISQDSTSGATEIEKKAVEMFQVFTKQFDQNSYQDLHLFKKQIEHLCLRLFQAQPTMAPLFNLSNSILQLLNTGKSLEEIKKSLLQTPLYDNITKNILENARKILPRNGCIITHSRSSTIVNILKNMPGINVTCTESRPLNEGRQLAMELSSHGIPVTLVADGTIFQQIPKATCVLVGADAGGKPDGDARNQIPHQRR